MSSNGFRAGRCPPKSGRPEIVAPKAPPRAVFEFELPFTTESRAGW